MLTLEFWFYVWVWNFFCFISLSVGISSSVTYMPYKIHFNRVRKWKDIVSLGIFCFVLFRRAKSRATLYSVKFSTNIIIHTSCLSCEASTFVLDVSLLLMALSPYFLHLFEPPLFLPASQFTFRLFSSPPCLKGEALFQMSSERLVFTTVLILDWNRRYSGYS